MTDASSAPHHVHLVGAIGLDTVPETYETLGRILGDRLRRVPDGEPGGRRMWIAWQFPLLRANPYLQAVPPAPGQSIIFFPYVKLAEGVDPAELRFCELGYAREAMTSYEEFKQAKAAGKLPAHVRFQVSLPTPYAVVSAFTVADDVSKVEPPYEAAMLREVATLCAKIPHGDLAIQWDVCPEMVAWDGRLPRMSNLADPKKEIIERLKRISDAVPADVELGYHLCYGDVDGKHFIEPIDIGKAVELANALSEAVSRPIAYIHMPVPIARSDEDFFRPLEGLKLKPGAELYLGCVHAEDGVDGTNRRIAAARKFAPEFGIATECGMGRCKTPEVVVELLEVHAGASTVSA